MRDQAFVEKALAGYEYVLQTSGPAGLSYLNTRVQHRYTAVYQLIQGVMHNMFLHDKQGEVVPEFLMAVRLQDSFCQFVLRDGLFATVDSANDQRLDGHIYQGAVGSYYGLPLLDNRGELYGTLCHFDTATHDLSDAEFAFLQQAVKVLPKYLGRSMPVHAPKAQRTA